jgi:arabinose-5-phosphate isomerase
MGDALAVVLINKKKFKTSDFKKIHPGGNLGQRLSRKVKDIMLTGQAVPSVRLGTPMAEAIEEMNRLELGVTLVVQDDEKLAGIITDGDLRRLMTKQLSISDLKVEHVMTKNPRAVRPDTPAYDALNLMEEFEITVLPIIDALKKVEGILHLHDILGKGDFKFNGT